MSERANIGQKYKKETIKIVILRYFLQEGTYGILCMF